MSEASDWERFLVDARTDTACPRAREYLQRLMVDCLVEQVDRDVAQILTRYRSYLAVREQRGEPSGDRVPQVEQLRQALSELRERVALEAMASLEALLAGAPVSSPVDPKPAAGAAKPSEEHLG